MGRPASVARRSSPLVLLARRYAGSAMSTRKLILAALVCGLAILVAGTVLLLLS